MISFPNAKINLGLRILRKRDDGYHDLETVFYPLPFSDALEILPLPDKSATSFTSTGISLPAGPEQNLCLQASDLLKKDFPSLPNLQIQLYKAIPTGAGLGGGSADASFTLKLLNTIFRLNISEQQLLQYALQLGSDCPFFIINQPCFATGRGEQLERISINLAAYKIITVNPGIHLSTAKAFSMLKPAIPSRSVKEIVAGDIQFWRQELINDFEVPVFEQYPEIGHIKNELYKAGAVYASLSGSGSTVYGIFDKAQSVLLNFSPSYLVKELAGQF